MKRLNFTILTVFILVISLSISTVNCSASEAYFDDLVEAELATQEAMDMYNYYLSSDIVQSYLSEINSYEYVIVRCDVYSTYTYLHFFCFNDDVVMFKYWAEGNVLGVLSKSESISCKQFNFSTNSSVLNPDGSIKVDFNSSTSLNYTEKLTYNDVVYTKSSHWSCVCSVGCLVRCDVPVYQDSNSAALALEGNDIKPLYGNTITYSQSTADKLYFKSFYVIPHIGTSLSTSYFVFNYELSDYAKSNAFSLYLSHQYCFNVQMPIFERYRRSKQYGKVIDLTKTKGTFILYCDELQGLIDFKSELLFSDDNIIGRALSIDATETLITLLGVDVDVGDVLYIETSNIRFTCQIRGSDNGKYVSGQWKSFTYDFLTHKSNTAGVVPDKDNWLSSVNPTYTVDANGEQSHNSYFYTDTTTNSDDTTTTKYYYTDGDKTTEITYNQYTNNEVPSGMSNPWVINAEGGNSLAEGGSAVANATATIGDIIINIPPQGGGGSSDYITIEDDDLTSEGLMAAISHGFGYFDNIDTGVKGDGLIAMITGLYGYLPGDLASMTMFGLATTFGIIIIRRILNK